MGAGPAGGQPRPRDRPLSARRIQGPASPWLAPPSNPEAQQVRGAREARGEMPTALCGSPDKRPHCSGAGGRIHVSICLFICQGMPRVKNLSREGSEVRWSPERACPTAKPAPRQDTWARRHRPRRLRQVGLSAGGRGPGPHATSSAGLTPGGATACSCHGPLGERAGRRTCADRPVGESGGRGHLLARRLPHLSVLRL